MSSLVKYFVLSICLFVVASQPLLATTTEHPAQEKELNVKELILEHLADGYEWHIVTIDDKHVSIPLPVIVFGENSGLNIFLSSNFHHGTAEYNGFHIASEGEYRGKIVEKNSEGVITKPWDFSITKNVFSLILASILLVTVVLSVAKWYPKHSTIDNPKVPKGFIGFMELFVMNVNDDIIKPCVGKNYKKFAPYLLTAFFFIFTNNLLGLVPLFPGGANVTGNIAVTLV
ncbi:MAG: synthase subunit, partial [Bacteroidota bacterium]